MLVATASLELGIDIGDVDLVCQLGSPRSINAFLQRVGRSGHAVGGTPKGRLFPLSRDELVECAALLDAVRRGELDRLKIPREPAGRGRAADRRRSGRARMERGRAVRAVHARLSVPQLSRARNSTRSCRCSPKASARGAAARRAHSSRCGESRAACRRGTRLTAITSGGTIPDTADYKVMLEPEGHIVGTLNEDFAVESLAGDVFQLGNTSYRILRVERGTVRVEDAHGQPPTIPFWLGEAPGRTDELSVAVSRLRQEIEQLLDERHGMRRSQWLTDEVGLERGARRCSSSTISRPARAALG